MTVRPLLFMAVIAPEVFLPDALAEGGRDLFRVLMELLRTVGRHGVLLDLDNGKQFDADFVRRMNEEVWTREALDAKAQEEERLATVTRERVGELAQEIAAVAKRLEEIRTRLSGLRGGAGLARRLEEEKKSLQEREKQLTADLRDAEQEVSLRTRRADRFRRLPAEFGTWYTQMLEMLSTQGRLLRVPTCEKDLLVLGPEEFGGEAHRCLRDVHLEPGLIVVPPGWPPSDRTVTLLDFAQQDFLARLAAGDAVVRKVTGDYRRSLGSIVRSAHDRLLIIDPYVTGLAGSSRRYEPFLRLLFELIAERPETLPPLNLEFHVNELGNEFNSGARMRLLILHEKKPDNRERYVRDIHNRLSRAMRDEFFLAVKSAPELEKRLRRIEVIYWRERFSFRRSGTGRVVDADPVGERFHDRYFLADHAGVELPYGLDCADGDASADEQSRTPNHTILKLLSRDAKEFVESRFRWGRHARNLPYESADGPLAIPMK